MRSCYCFLSAVLVIALAFWAYRENYETQAAQARAIEVQEEIATARTRLRVLNAEWAYLNRPDRLRDLAEINFDRLGLLTLQPHQFGKISDVVYPLQPVQLTESFDIMEREQLP